MTPVEQYLEHKLRERQQAGNLRRLKTERASVDFFSNDYLGLATDGFLAAMLPEKGMKQITGSTGSRLLSGNSKAAEVLEEEIALFHNAEAALLFNSGYDANIGLLASVTNRHTTILYDELCHASIIDGIKLSLSPRQYKFRHNDLDDLQQKLAKLNKDEPVLIVAESVYSMDGDIAPLNELSALAHKHHALLIVDEAHATGVFGPQGAGIVAELNLEDKVFARVHTFGKALGCHGAAVVGSLLLKQYLINFARSFIYTTALPLHTLYTIKNAYHHLAQPSFCNKTLHDLITYFRQRIKDSGIDGWKDSVSPIQALITAGNERTVNIAKALQEADMQVNPILHPTVPEGMERLRICLHSFNTTTEIDRLFDILKAYR